MPLVFDIVKSLVFGNGTHETHLSHPINGVVHTDWLRFVKVFLNIDNRVSENFRYGCFEMTVRRLCDLRLMNDPTTVQKNGRLVWVATWVDPWNLKRFLDDPDKQYEIFSRSMSEYAALDLDTQLGVKVEGTEATLSGLLAVAHRAGLPGLASWLSNAAERREFSNTTDYFTRANGIF